MLIVHVMVLHLITLSFSGGPLQQKSFAPADADAFQKNVLDADQT
jgi:hypothetical protein